MFQFRNHNVDPEFFTHTKRVEEVIASQAKKVYEISFLSAFITVLKAPIK